LKKRLIILLTVLALILPTFYVSADSELVNVARFQMSFASTEAEGHSADLANDGINDNPDHTYWKNADGDTKPYWQVDLGLPYKLTRIELEARKGAGENERKNIRILASETENFKESVELTNFAVDYGEMLTVEVTKKAKYRFIRLEKTDAHALSIGEIRVLVKKGDIAQGIDAVSLAGQIPSTDEEGRYTVPSDVLGTRYEKAVTLLSALNIMRGYPDGDFLPDEAITRAEFTTVAMRLLANTMSLSTRSFVDVSADHWAYSQIESATKLGIVNGIGNDMFSPDTPVLTPQVIKILVSVLGYGEAAEQMGGYPDGYNNIAASLELYKDVELSGDNITRGEIAILVYNALETDIMSAGLAGDYEIHTAIEDKTVLTEYLGLEKDKGIVTGVKNTSLAAVAGKRDSDYLEIDGKAFKSNIPNAYSYIGYSVDYYYENDEDEEEKNVVALIKSRKNQTYEINAKDIIKIEDDTIYYDFENDEKLTLAPDMDLIYNGVCLEVYDKKIDLKPASGTCLLIDNDGDGEIEVYIVNKIDNYVVKSVNPSKSQVYSKNVSGVLTLDAEESDVTITDKSTGKAMVLSEVSEWNVLSVMESRNESGKKHYNVIVSTELVRGTYNGIGKDYVQIDDRSFEVAECFDTDSVELGAKGIFYLDAENKIAAFSGDAEPGVKYGFLRAAGEDKNSMEEGLSLRVFAESGSFVTLKTAEKYVIDGQEYTDPKKAEAYLKLSGIEGTTAQAIRYTVNAKGEVKSIETTNGSLSKDFDAANGNPAPKTNGKGYYYTTAGTFDAAFTVDEKTVMIELPPEGLSSEKDYNLLSAAGVRAGRYYYVEAYDTGEERLAKMVIFTGGASGGASDSTTFFLAEEINLALNADGEEAYEVRGLYSGEEHTYFIDSDLDVDVSDFKPGTVLTLAFTGDVISDYEVKFFEGDKPEGAPNASVSTNTPQYGANIQGLMGTLWLGYGTVETKTNSTIRVSLANSDVQTPGSSADFVNYEEVMINLANVRVYYYDSEKEKATVANAGYVLDKATVGADEASKVLVRADSGNFVEMIILD